MDNDNKVISAAEKQIHQEVRLFLHKEIANIQQENSLSAYNLEEEYGKTKKHKSPFSIFLLAGCFFAVVAAAAVLTVIIAKNDKNVKVELSEFNDLNLKNLLDSVGKVQAKYDNAVNFKKDLQLDFENEKKQAESKREQDMFVIESMNILNKNDEKQRLDKIQNEYLATIEKIEIEYAEKFAKADEEIAEYKSELEQYDTAKVEAAQEQERMLNSERLVQELERQKLAAQYEQRIAELEATIESLRKDSSAGLKDSVQAIREKYQAEIDRLDPKLNDEQAAEIILNVKEVPDFNSDSILSKNQGKDSTVLLGFDKFQSAYDYYLYLDSTVASIPQKNSIPGYVAASKALVNNLGETFTETTLALQNEKTSLKIQKQRLESNYDELMEDYNELVEDYNETCDEFEETLNSTIAQLEKSLENEEVLKSEKEELIKNHDETVKTYDEVLSGLLISTKSSAVIYSADSKDNIRIFVADELQSVIKEKIEGVSAEFKSGKVTVKGIIKSDGEKYFLFEPAKDKNGTEMDFDLSLVGAGIPVKVKLK